MGANIGKEGIFCNDQQCLIKIFFQALFSSCKHLIYKMFIF